MTSLYSDNAIDLTRERPQLSWVDESTVRVCAAAKVNLTLAVGPERSDGYHAFESLMASVTWFDDLLVRRDDGADVRLTCDDPSVPTDGTNLICRAARLYAWAAKVEPDVSIHLEKRLPMQAGLGGGSSDAAATLFAMNALWGHRLTNDQLIEVASALGSDVGFFLGGALSICRGRGEQVFPVSAKWLFYALIVKPAMNCPTGAIYRACRDDDRCCFGSADALASAIAAGSTVSELSGRFCNDLEAPAFRVQPALGRVREELEAELGVPVRLSGSGSAMFAVFESPESAVAMARRIKLRYPDWTCVATKANTW